jgi:hypothetical protein
MFPLFPLANDPSGQQQPNEKKGDSLSAMYALCVIHSNCILVFLRTGFGKEALGMAGLLSLVLLFLCLGGDPRMIWWIAAYLVAIIVQRVITFRATRKGAVIHSMYSGTPWLAKTPLARSEHGAMFVEALLCFVLGALFQSISPFIGKFMMLGFVTLMLRRWIEETVYKRRLMRMQDAQIEGAWYGASIRR